MLKVGEKAYLYHYIATNDYVTSNDLFSFIDINMKAVRYHIADILCVCSGLWTRMACPNYEVVRILTWVPTLDRGQTGPRL